MVLAGGLRLGGGLVVDANGKVLGVSPGEIDIVVTGADSKAQGKHRVVVIAVTISPDEVTVPFYDKWLRSAHADTTAEPFNHWNEEGVIPKDCARCHSTPGYRDYIGADGSAADETDTDHATGTVIECTACHNDVALTLSHVIFPSGVEVDGLGPEARCMTCHQGRASSDTVDNDIADADVATPDTVSTDLGFLNIHYYAAGATLMAGRVRGGYQYDGQVYDWRFRHVPGVDTCVGCHDPHSLQLKFETCNQCHPGTHSKDDVKNIRMIASRGQDYDGDGDKQEGIYYELEGLKATLLADIRTYGEQHGGAICYESETYPYFFRDSDADGVCTAEEAVFANRYASWTARLVRAAYNFSAASKDPGAFAHNGKYMIQLVHDSIEDLNKGISTPRDLTAMIRNDVGHFNGAGEPARHWDADEEVSSGCSKCHGGSEGFRFFLDHGVGANVEEPDNGLDCATCHTNFTQFETVKVASVVFPSGVSVNTSEAGTDGICVTCHQGRESKKSVDAQLAAGGNGGFKNIHYLPAGATRYGADVHVGYEYAGKTYAGHPAGHAGGDNCTSCHNPVTTNHTFYVSDNIGYCATCHLGVTKPEDIRMPSNTTDWDGDGSGTESLKAELDGIAAALLRAMQASSNNKICYNENAYPYFFIDTDSDGECSAAEAISPNAFKTWGTGGLLPAAFNYQFYKKEPGAWAHNFKYMAQILIDGIEALGGDVSSFTRPQ
ncbi:MAG: hypothetical protein H6745_21775 [Deltaproteobacteria bacterium]|nr:hypothetical protein [Deltaproteobacteria bacterium]